MCGGAAILVGVVLEFSGDDSGHAVVSYIGWMHGHDRWRSWCLNCYSPALAGVWLAGVVGLGLVVEVDEVGAEVVCCASDFSVEFVFCECGAWEGDGGDFVSVVDCAQGVVDGHWGVVDHGDACVGCYLADFVELGA